MRRSIRYVKTDTGEFYLQVWDEQLFPHHKFAILSDDQTWEGGFGCASSWTIVPSHEVPNDIRRELDEVIESLSETFPVEYADPECVDLGGEG
jgi:hypothetical protein